MAVLGEAGILDPEDHTRLNLVGLGFNLDFCIYGLDLNNFGLHIIVRIVSNLDIKIFRNKISHKF
jgi:hypothetical protein